MSDAGDGPPAGLRHRFLPTQVNSWPGARWFHRVAPFAVEGDPGRALRRLKEIVGSMPRTEIVAATDARLHAVCRTRSGFRDDLEFRHSPSEGVVHVRSAARKGVFDFGVNRRRVERVRREWAKTAE